MYKVVKGFEKKKLSKKTDVGTIAIDFNNELDQEKLAAYARWFPEAIKFEGKESKKESKKEDSKDEKKN